MVIGVCLWCDRIPFDAQTDAWFTALPYRVFRRSEIASRQQTAVEGNPVKRLPLAGFVHPYMYTFQSQQEVSFDVQVVGPKVCLRKFNTGWDGNVYRIMGQPLTDDAFFKWIQPQLENECVYLLCITPNVQLSQ